jgi:hypothetical protein
MALELLDRIGTENFEERMAWFYFTYRNAFLKWIPE